jgi:hypothetical protein
MFKISEKSNPNYLAQIIKLENIQPHPNADRLQIAVVQGNSVIVSLDAKEGDVYVYFPLECAINKEFLSWSNSFSDKTMNSDTEIAGFFGKQGRVKAVKLRGAPSMGYAVPRNKLEMWLSEKEKKAVIISDDLIGKEFDSYNDIIICEKYVNPVALKKQNKEKKNQKKVVREPKVVDSQFYFHINTPQLRKLIHNISPNDYIAITRKLHGTSWVAARLLCNKKLTWQEKLLKRFGVKIVDTEYDLLWASRRVLKNGYLEVGNKDHFYSYDLWEEIAKSVEYAIQDSITLYGECVGYTNTGSFIQNGYDYGCPVGQFKTYIYRITTTNQSGQVYEFSHNQVKDYCEKFGLTMVPELYYGKAGDLYPELSVKEHWHENFLQRLIEDYLEKDCDLCKSQKVPDEGICLRKDIFDIEVYKLKSFKFLEWETKQLDKEDFVDIESSDV